MNTHVNMAQDRMKHAIRAIKKENYDTAIGLLQSAIQYITLARKAETLLHKEKYDTPREARVAKTFAKWWWGQEGFNTSEGWREFKKTPEYLKAKEGGNYCE